MLEYLQLNHVGPADRLELRFAPRLNLLTGDNGLGKSFLLDVAWWALTRKWPADLNPNLATGLRARPTHGKIGDASIEFRFSGRTVPFEYRSEYDRADQAWTGKPGRPAIPGLVLYALVDGGFALWDQARNYWRRKGDLDVQERPPAYVFSAREVWDGLESEQGALCNGLIRDWASWQKENGETFAELQRVLRRLSPADEEILGAGELTRVSLDDVRDMPTVRMPYGQDVPIVHASAGIRRIVALAYLLVWSWQEHVRASRLLQQETAEQVIFIVDEIEAHLHPRWQRSILRSLMGTVEALTGETGPAVQIVAATHSPLVLASVEALFDPGRDAWFDIDLVVEHGRSRVSVERKPWERHGEVGSWLTSEAFDLGSARSLEAEKVLEEAAMALSDEGFDTRRAVELDRKLRTLLGDTDPFWLRWRFVGEKRGWLPPDTPGDSNQGPLRGLVG